MLFHYSRGIAHPPFLIDKNRAILADSMIAREVARERSVLKYLLRQAGIPFHPETETDDLVTGVLT